MFSGQTLINCAKITKFDGQNPSFEKLTCSADLVNRPVGLVHVIAGDVIAQSNGRHGDEAVVEGVEVVPFVLDDGEDGGGDEEDEDDEAGEEDGDVDEADVQCAVRMAQLLYHPVQHLKHKHLFIFFVLFF